MPVEKPKRFQILDIVERIHGHHEKQVRHLLTNGVVTNTHCRAVYAQKALIEPFFDHFDPALPAFQYDLFIDVS